MQEEATHRRMTNGASSGSGPPASYSAGPSTGSMPRRSSYASVVSGAAPQLYSSSARSGALSHLLSTNPNASNLPQYTPDQRFHRQGPSQDIEMNTNGSIPFGSTWRKSASLPSYSRQFANGWIQGHHLSDSFFVPSYLRNSRYMSKLERAHKEKLANQRETSSAQSSNPPSLSTSASNVNIHRLAPSHRGMTFDVIDHAPQPDDALIPLPSRWHDLDKYSGLDVLQDGLEIRYNGPNNKLEHEAAAARTDSSISPQCGMYYFEVTILSKSKDGYVASRCLPRVELTPPSMIAVGFSGQKASLERLPGWEPESWAFHGDDGKAFGGESTGKNYGPTFTTNDIVGCGINFVNGSIFFTKNGVFLGVCHPIVPVLHVDPSRQCIQRVEEYQSIPISWYEEAPWCSCSCKLWPDPVCL